MVQRQVQLLRLCCVGIYVAGVEIFVQFGGYLASYYQHVLYMYVSWLLRYHFPHANISLVKGADPP